jgi:hypothetical protein
MKSYAEKPCAYLKVTGLLSLMILLAPCAWAQLRIVGAVSGTVIDPTGAVVANAKVTLKDTQTGITKEAASTDGGTFLFPDLAVGSYAVTVTASGFKTATLTNISVSTNQTADVRVNLELGAASETITVSGSDLQALETSSQLVASTLSTKTVTQLPVGNRSNVLALARLAPGASPPTQGSTRYNNLAGGAVNVTVDGINDASNGFKSGGTVFFMTVPVRLGAVEEVSVETGGLGADSGAQSGANIKFTTRRGGAQYHGSAFYEPTSERFNANSWSRNAQGLERAFSRTQNYGGNFSGPLIPFGYFKDKLFAFVNFERAYSPVKTPRTVTVLTPDAQKGLFTYVVNGTTNQFRTVNVLDLARSRALRTNLDSVTQAILAINNQVPNFATKIADTDLNRDTYTWDAENNNYAYFPTTRVDYYATPKQQLTFTWNYRHNWQAGERRLPVPDIQRTNPFRLGYFVYSAALQSTFTPKTFNEFRYGVQHSGDTNTRDEYGPYYQFNSAPLRIGGNLQFANGAAPNPVSPVVPFIDQQNTTGRHFITTMYDTLTMNRGQHTITLGGSLRKTSWNDVAVVYQVPTYNTGTPNNDPLLAAQAFTVGTLPGINPNNLGDPLALYNLLTGRVSAANFTRVVNPDTFQYDGVQEQNFTFTNSLMGGLYAQDRWRIRQSLTLNYGLRWEVQGPMKDGKGLSASPDLASIFGPSKRLFAPGELSGNNNPTVEVGRLPYNTDWLNFAPNFGFAWNPSKTGGLMGKLLGDGKTVFRGSYSVIVYDEGTQFFAANLGPNAGKTIGATTLIPGQPGATNLPAFYTLSDIVANPLTVSNFAFSTTEYKKVINQADQTFVRTLRGFDPNLRAPYTVNYTFGVQRELWRNNVLEIRYVGNQSKLSWRTSNLNEVNIFENGFLQEFKNAQRNLQINQAAGVSSFQNLGRPGQVALPIFDAAFGSRGALGPIAAGNGYGATAFITNLQNGEAGALANTLATNQNYVCRMFGSNFSPCARVLPTANAPGAYPINFFLLNPFSAGRLDFVDNGGWSSYNGLQIQFRQRLSQSLNWTTNYTWSKSLTNLAVDNQNQSLDYLTLRDPGLNRRLSPFDIGHVIQTFGTYDLPIGRGRWLSIDNRVLNGVVGGWTLGSVFVFNTGQPIQLTGGFNTVSNTNNPAANGVRLAPGVTLEQIQKMFDAQRTRVNRSNSTDLQRIAVDLGLIGPDGRANSEFLIPNSTPGEFGQLLFLRDKNTFQWDVSMTKTFQIMEKARFEIFAGFNNVLNHPRWGFPSADAFSTSFGIVGAPGGSRSINLRATLSF